MYDPEALIVIPAKYVQPLFYDKATDLNAVISTPSHDMRFTPSAIIRAAERATGFTKGELLSASRGHALVAARWAMWRVMQAAGMSPTAIGRRCNRDHTTVLYGLPKANSALVEKIKQEASNG